MANYSLSLNSGQTEFQIREGTDAPSTGDLELSINISAMPGNSGGAWCPNGSVLQMLKMLENFLSGKSKTIS